MQIDEHERLVAALASKHTVPAACMVELGGVRATGSPVLTFFSDPDNPGEMFDLGWRHPLTCELQHDADCYRVIVGVSGGPLETLAWDTGIVPVEGSAVTWIRMLGDQPWWEIPDYSRRAIFSGWWSLPPHYDRAKYMVPTLRREMTRMRALAEVLVWRGRCARSARHGWLVNSNGMVDRDGEVHELGGLEDHLGLPRWEVLPKQPPVTPTSAPTTPDAVQDTPGADDSKAAQS